MLEFLSSDEDAIVILKKDHDKVKDLFKQFENSDNRREKKSIVAQALQALKIHTVIEEEIFYPTVRRQQEVEEQLMNEADEEHHVAKLLIAELDQMSGSEDHFDAKFHVLAESVRHHIKEEEGKVMPEARRADIDFEALGRQLLARKEELMEQGVPFSAEEKMISRYGQKADSPAQNKRKQSMRRTSGRKSARTSYSSGTRTSGRRTTTTKRGRL